MDTSRRSFLRQAAGFGLVAPFNRPAWGNVRAEAALQPGLPAPLAGETVLALAGDFFLTTALPEPVGAPTEQLFDVMRGAHGAFANLENGLSTVGSPELGGYRWGAALRGHPSLVKELTRVGIDAVSTANNHTCNYGREALLETLATLDAAGVNHAGGGRSVAAAFRPTWLTVNGLKVAFFSLYSCHYNRVSQEIATDDLPGVACARAYDVMIELPGHFEERNVRPNIFPLMVNPASTVMAPLREDVARLTAAIQSGREDADVAILSVHFHWARHTKPDVPYHQRVIAHAAVDAGIDLFVGHGPHTLRGVEVYRGKPILFSIGNFILQPQKAGATAAEADHGHQSVVARAVVASGKATRVELLPIVIGANGMPRLAQDEIGRAILDRVAGMSAEFGTEVARRGWYGSVELGPGAPTNG
jgi:poly-gamma-glutamate capsule biosynthesis protein CapA/YwtB (metallophosphatase superfamily)